MHISRLKWVLLYIVVCLANNVNLEELLEEIGALRETLLQQNNFLSSLGDPLPNTGCWYYVPSNQNVRNMLFWHEKRNTLVFFLLQSACFFCPQAPSFGSQGTQDSGLGSVHPQSPEKGQRSKHRAHRERPVNGGYWVYSPHPHNHGKRGKCHGTPVQSLSLQRHHGQYHVSAVISVLVSLQMHRCSETVKERAI